MEHWYLYMDEGGVFEKLRRNDPLYIYAVLIRELDLNFLEEKFKKIIEERSKHLHASDFYRGGKNKDIAKRILDLTKKSNIIVARIKHVSDIYYQREFRESFISNRYLHMLQAIIEHIIFLYPDFLGRKLRFSLRPNTRVFIVNKGSRKFQEYLKMGFKGKDCNKGKYLFYIFDADIIRTEIINMQKEYYQYSEVLGERIVDSIEDLLGNTTEDIFSYWVDHLAYFTRAPYFSEFKSVVDDLVTIDLQYGPMENLYRKIIKNFLANQLSDSLILLLDNANIINTNKYYRVQLEKIGKLLLDKLQLSLEQIQQLEKKINEMVRFPSGKWSFVLNTIEYMLKALERGCDSVIEIQKNDYNKLLKRIYSHKLSIHNHRSEVLSAWKVLQKINEISLQSLSFEEWREEVEIHNRAAVASANMFEFEKSNLSLEQDLKLLEQIKENIKSVTQKEIKDPILGKVLGTLGQNYGFLAPFKPELFTKAEDCFLRAKAEFVKERDRQRQDIYLLHLYYDWQKIDNTASQKGQALFKELVNEPDVRQFLNNPSPENAKYKQFILQVILKYHLEADSNIIKEFCKKFTLCNLRKFFEDAANEHPFEFIYAYLGIMCMQCDNLKDAETYFESALQIPVNSENREQPTLQAIRAQIIARYALELYRKDEKKDACEKMQDAVKIMEQLGKHPDYKPILSLQDGQAVYGWFKDAWNKVAEVDWTNDFNEEACKRFLKYFTFNYS